MSHCWRSLALASPSPPAQNGPVSGGPFRWSEWGNRLELVWGLWDGAPNFAALPEWRGETKEIESPLTGTLRKGVLWATPSYYGEVAVRPALCAPATL